MAQDASRIEIVRGRNLAFGMLRFSGFGAAWKMRAAMSNSGRIKSRR
jgi:hypothetical protein